MAEIKSTLDLVLERTRNLKISEAEKNELREKELKGKIKGLLRKYLDGYVHFDTEYRNLIKHLNEETARKLLAEELIEQFDPIAGRPDETEKLWTIMEKTLRIDVAVLEKKIAGWKASLRSAQERRAAEIKEGWLEKQLSGPALIPNLEKDPEWKGYIAKQREELRNDLRVLFR